MREGAGLGGQGSERWRPRPDRVGVACGEEAGLGRRRPNRSEIRGDGGGVEASPEVTEVRWRRER